MKVSGAVIQDRNILVFTDDAFAATYKGKVISISTNHGFGKPKFDHLTRYDISVTDKKTGRHDVDSYEDFHTMKDAIRLH